MENGQDPEQDNENEVEDQELEANGSDDVSLRPGPNADNTVDVDRYISAEVRALFAVGTFPYTVCHRLCRARIGTPIAVALWKSN